MFDSIFNFIFWCMMTLSLGSFIELRDKFKAEAANAQLNQQFSLGRWARKLDDPHGLHKSKSKPTIEHRAETYGL